MKNKIALFSSLLLLLIASCNNKQKELELKEKELELKEREIILKENEVSKVKVSENSNNKNSVTENRKKLRYLYFANGGLKAYFSDGTTVSCPRCDFCKSNIEAMFKKEPDGTYSNDEILNEIIGNRENHTLSEDDSEGWALVNYKWNIKVPQF